MKTKLLPEPMKSSDNYVNNEQRLRKIKINVLLVIAVVIVCMVTHLNDKNNGTGFTESNKSHYFDTPKHLKVLNLHVVRAA
ncbi:hypothetical protein FO440_16355 [Mucilaginibacter corticis]|uniref:Uncharacterized protein n=1 Tax=Mucilaginibacter corticis TaxID=2597670 RepID=A0A556MHK2_9SPHI|nr:hypothetical protein [Mucilaginibacter corticis]TSJ39322.1 hypothetical protein FO440_16355 [Mucilaginibacter corticis]